MQRKGETKFSPFLFAASNDEIRQRSGNSDRYAQGRYRSLNPHRQITLNHLASACNKLTTRAHPTGTQLKIAPPDLVSLNRHYRP
jgi:hypothetical protein